MNTATASIIVAIITVVGSITGAFLVPNSPWINPQFSAKVLEFYSDDTKLNHVVIENIGWTQAKNAVAFIEFSQNSVVESNSCFEGEIKKLDESNTYQISFERMSTNVRCVINFIDPINSSLINLVVTSEDSNGYEWDKIPHLMTDVPTAIAIESTSDEISDADLLLNIISIIAGILGIISVILIRIKRGR